MKRDGGRHRSLDQREVNEVGQVGVRIRVKRKDDSRGQTRNLAFEQLQSDIRAVRGHLWNNRDRVTG